MAKGGKQPGAGRPKGSTTRPQLRDYINEEEVGKIIREAKKKAREGDTNMLKFILEQIFGKAPQSLDLTTLGRELPTPILGGTTINDNEKRQQGEDNEG